MKSELRSYDMSDRQFLDLTPDLRDFASGMEDGLVHVFVPHATAGVALMETGSGSEQDLEDAIDRLLPRGHAYTHSHGSPGHGADHLLPAFISPSTFVPVLGGEPQLGTWQSLVLVDTNRDNPFRKVRFSYIIAD
jgi:secondary thiamine-phosphate synthase enzyme